MTVAGAGIGDPELLTLRALRALQTADGILIDDDVSPEVAAFARREARKMLIRATSSTSEISATMLALARAGRRVVRLKRGICRQREPTTSLGLAGRPDYRSSSFPG